jgi:hypothetical protein
VKLVPLLPLGLLVLVACGGSGSAPADARSPSSGMTSPPVPRPVRTVVRTTHTYAAGRTASLNAQAGVALRLTASAPDVSRGRLSSSHGYPPARGYYVTFHISVVNTGSKPIDLVPTSFYVRVPGEGRVTSYDGNSPYSGAGRQLDHTELDPGQTVRAPLTFDVRSPHGRLAFAPDGSAAIAWLF